MGPRLAVLLSPPPGVPASAEAAATLGQALQPTDELWLPTPLAHQLAGAWPSGGPALCAVAAATVLAATQADWVVAWPAGVGGARLALPRLRQALAATPAALLQLRPAKPSPQGTSLLQHFVAAARHATFAPYRHGDALPADVVAAADVAVACAAARAVGGVDGRYGDDVQHVDLARRLYAAGHALQLVDVGPRLDAGRPSWPAYVAAWTRAGRDYVELVQRHGDPHVAARLRARLGPYRTLLADAPRLARQLAELDDQLARSRRVDRAVLTKLSVSVHQLYGTSLLRGVLATPQGRSWLQADAPPNRSAPRPGEPAATPGTLHA